MGFNSGFKGLKHLYIIHKYSQYVYLYQPPTALAAE